MKGLKSIKAPNFVLFCGINFYVMPTQPFQSPWGVYSNKLFLALNIRIKSSANKQLIFV